MTVGRCRCGHTQRTHGGPRGSGCGACDCGAWRHAVSDDLTDYDRERMSLDAAEPIAYGTPGGNLPPDVCRECWGERWVWLGNTWGSRHLGDGLSGCHHECHADEVWLA